MENNSTTNRTSTNVNPSSTTATNSSTTTLNSTAMVSSSASTLLSGSTPTIRQSHKRTFAESDSSSRTERHLCSFSHLWVINYLSSYIEDSNFTCLQSETFSPVNTPYSNTRWSLKLYPRGLNEKQHTNNNIAIFLKYVSGTMPTIKAKAEFSVVSRNNELVMLRSTNFHTFSSGNDWGYSEFLDGNYLNSRRNDLLTDDRLRVYVRVILVDEKETTTGDIFQSSHNFHHHHHHHHHHHQSGPTILPPSLPSQQQQISTVPKTHASTSSSSSSASSSSTTASTTNSNTSNPSIVTPIISSGLFNDEKERFKSLELLSNQIKLLIDDGRFTDVRIHVMSKTENDFERQKPTTNEDHRKSARLKRSFNKQQHPSCSSCHCTSEKTKSILNNNERVFDHHHHEQSSIGVIPKESDSINMSNDSRLCQISTPRRTTRSTTSLLSRMAQSSTETIHSSLLNYSTSSVESSSDICSSSSTLSINSKRCLCTCHNHDNNELDITYDIQQSYTKYLNLTPLATFHAHKAILVARSSFFASQIRLKNLHGSSHNLKSPPIDLYIDDLEPSTVRAMLIYIYTGRLPISNDDTNNNLNPIDLFRAAVKHDLNELRDMAKSAMIDVLKVDNAIDMLEVSDQANDATLKQQVLGFIRSHAAAVSKTSNWLSFTKNNPHLIIDAFRSLVTPTITNTTIVKHNNTTTTTNNNNNLNHYHHSSSLTPANKYSKYD